MKWLNTRGNSVLTIQVCDRCKMKRAYDDVQEDGNTPGLRVCKFGCIDNKDPYRLKMRQPEKISVRFPRPDAYIGTGNNQIVTTPNAQDLLSLQTNYTENGNLEGITYTPVNTNP
jgi:hypothetical protein